MRVCTIQLKIHRNAGIVLDRLGRVKLYICREMLKQNILSNRVQTLASRLGDCPAGGGFMLVHGRACRYFRTEQIFSLVKL
jgi:hypothetical protein